MGRSIKIKRNGHFVGCIIKYFCILNINIIDFQEWILNVDGNILNEQYLQFPISNKQEIEINIDSNENKLFVVACTSTGVAFSNEIIIDAGDFNHEFILDTRYSWRYGSRYLLTKVL